MKRFFMLIFLPLVITTIKYRPERTDSYKDYKAEFNLNTSHFPKLENFHVNGATVDELLYPYIAKVVHSTKFDLPYLCTAACVQNRLFMTAARCLTGHALQYVRVIYKGTRLSVAAFVLPLNETKQQFDDIGFIVTNNELNETEYSTVLITERVRSKRYFWEWMPNITLGEAKAVGYAKDEDPNSSKYKLIAINIAVHTKDLGKIYSASSAYEVPLYNGCDYEKFEKDDPSCQTYLGVEGAVVVEVASNSVLGVATWGYVGNKTFPVGFAVANGIAFELNYKCAKILADTELKITPESYQRACDKLPV